MRRSSLLVALTLGLAPVLAPPAVAAPPAAFQLAALPQSADTNLLIAIFKDDAEGVKAALAAGAKADARFPGGNMTDDERALFGVSMDDFGAFTRLDNAMSGRDNALTLATLRGKDEIVKLLLDAKAKVNAPGGEGAWTALMISAKAKTTTLSDMLLAAGADVNFKSKGDFTALGLAIENDNLDLATKIAAKVTLVKDMEVQSMPVVAAAIRHDMFAVADTLIDKGFDTKMRLCLQSAIEKGNLPLVKKLVAKGGLVEDYEIKLATDNYLDEIAAFLKSLPKKKK